MMEDIESATPALCRLQLGAELRRLRREAGLKSSQVAKRLLWSPSKVTRLEYGDNVVVEPDDTAMLCGLYKADAETRSLLIDYATVTRTKQDRWASTGAHPSVGPTVHAFLGLEASATVVRDYESDYVPGLLQTEAYARAIHRTELRNYSSEEIEMRVAARMARQAALYRAEGPLELFVILSESVLRRRGGDSTVTVEQLKHIAEISTMRNVHVQVVPFSLGIHIGMSGPFTIIRFARASLAKPIVYLESMAASWVVARDSTIDTYEHNFRELQVLAPGPQEARNMIHEAIKEI
ncbi:transcriptional regulator [Embleya scabrispora]|uniref:Transcriptional regulator n=1 Tax=Embleya scabrispora TaxID=159449 RepID=A0A1T3NR12_9ACTN|nr:helix-turn-helix transcriptional regulator [Embleya scabrispora]OPC79194.1 transcriptional regulator [Embleya scabrispora]